jgi:hypothetical protein
MTTSLQQSRTGMMIINQLADMGTEERSRLCDSPDKVNGFLQLSQQCRVHFKVMP